MLRVKLGHACIIPKQLLELDTAELVKQCIKKDRKAQYIFYKKYFDFLYVICYRYMKSKDRSLDMLNLGFAKVMLNLKKYDTSQAIEKWMKTIVIHTIIDEFRKTKTYRENIKLYDETAIANVSRAHLNGAIANELNESIQIKLSELPPIAQKIFNLYAVDGYKHKEIAEMLEIPEGTCHWHYSEAKKTLKEYLSKEYSLGY